MSKAKKTKTTQQQFCKLLNFIEKCDILRYGKGSQEEKMGEWTTIAAELNSMGGAIKTVDAWNKTWIEWKSHIRAKLKQKKELSDIEKRCDVIAGLSAVSLGVENIQELGLGTSITEGIQIEIIEEPNLIAECEAAKDVLEADDFAVDMEANPEPGPSTSHKFKKIRNPTPNNRHKRTKRTTVEQYELYLDEFKSNKIQNDQVFENLCIKLNRCEGPKRDAKGWKQVFYEWEAKVKAKTRRIHYEHELTGGGLYTYEFLTKLEKKLLALLSRILLFGNPLVKELGFTEKHSVVYKTKNQKRKQTRKSNFMIIKEVQILESLKKNTKSYASGYSKIAVALNSIGETIHSFANCSIK
ncbi:hypothetical protein FQR65_LT16347 [Abscondita terminalis]|nr:hypothetical protein FQR65_LT16347 [Abscondita terminalis]